MPISDEHAREKERRMSIILAPLYTHPMADSDEHVTRKDEHHPRSLSLPRSLEIAERERTRQGGGKGSFAMALPALTLLWL